MSDETKNEGAEGGADALTNVKAEMNRKLGNIEAQIKSQNEAMLAQINALLAKTAPPKEESTVSKAKKPLKDLINDDPEEYARHVQEEARASAERLIEERTKKANEQQAVLSQLTSEYPELNDMNSELTKLAVEKYKGLGLDSPVGYRAAVAEAAAELGVRPKSKRKAESNDEAFSLGSGSGGRGTGEARVSPQQEAVMRDLAKKFGVNWEDKDTRDRLKKNHGRKSYGRWE